MYKAILLVLLYFSNNILTGQKNTSDIIMQAIQDEVDRCKSELKVDSFLPPYYIEVSYQIADVVRLISLNGQIIKDTSLSDYGHGRCDLRCGSFEVDHDNFIFENGYHDYSHFHSKRDEYLDIRENIWDALENQYNEKSKLYSQKKQLIEAGILKDTLPNFTRSPKILDLYVVEDTTKQLPPIIEELMVYLSSELDKHQSIYSAGLTCQIIKNKMYYYNTEGSKAYIFTTKFPTELNLNFKHFDVYNQVNNSDFSIPLNQDISRSDFSSIRENVFSKIQSLTSVNKIQYEGEYFGAILIEDDAVKEFLSEKLFEDKYGLFATKDAYNSSHTRTNMKYGVAELKRKYKKRVFSKDFNISIGNKKMVDNIELLNYKYVDFQGIEPKDSVRMIDKGIIVNLISDRTPTPYSSISLGYSKYNNLYNVRMIPNFINCYFDNNNTWKDIKKEFIQSLKDDGLKYGLIVKSFMDRSKIRGDNSIDRNRKYFNEAYIYDVENNIETPIYGAYINDVSVGSMRRIKGSGSDNLKSYSKSKESLIRHPKSILIDEVEVLGLTIPKFNLPVVNRPLHPID